MGHKILQKMVYSDTQPMWHALTQPSLTPMSALEIYKQRFGNGFSVELAQSGYMTESGQWVEDEGKFKILRSPIEANEFTGEAGDPNWVVFGDCTDRYHPLQPIEVAERFDEMVGEPVETMAFLGDGEDMFVSWKMPTIEVRPEDVVEMYAIIRGGFDTSNGWKLFTSTYRPVCYNTVTLAQGWADTNTNKESLRGNMWRGKGTSTTLLEDLGYWMKFLQDSAKQEVETTELFFKALAEQPITFENAQELLAVAYPYKSFDPDKCPPELRKRDGDRIADYNEGQRKLREGIYQVFSEQGTAISMDMWGLLNAGSEYFCHYMGSKKPIAESVMFGNRNSLTNKLIQVLKYQIS